MHKAYLAIFCLMGLLVSPLVVADVATAKHPFESVRGLARFDKSSTLRTSQNTDTILSIKNVKVGDNALQQAISLARQGGILGRIHGGSRSDKVTLSFDQAYQDTRLSQKIDLHFDKFNGFIHQVNATYLLQDAYLSITPIREQTFNAAVAKFGSPLSMQDIAKLSGQNQYPVRLDKFIQGIQKENKLSPGSLAYFQQLIVSRSSKWTKDDQEYALLHSGFDRCYMWQTNHFSQLLTLCFFDQTSANPNSRGVELELHDFVLAKQIKELGNPHHKPQIAL